MPSVVKVSVVEARGLPSMDFSSGSTDAYVSIHFAGEERRSAVCNRQLDPTWNFRVRFEVKEDEALLREPLSLIVKDKDAIMADNVIGSVVLSLEPILTHEHRAALMQEVLHRNRRREPRLEVRTVAGES